MKLNCEFTPKQNTSEDAMGEMGWSLKRSAKFRDLFKEEYSKLNLPSVVVNEQTGAELQKKVGLELMDLFQLVFSEAMTNHVPELLKLEEQNKKGESSSAESFSKAISRIFSSVTDEIMGNPLITKSFTTTEEKDLLNKLLAYTIYSIFKSL